jgi:hypothetical protein
MPRVDASIASIARSNIESAIAGAATKRSVAVAIESLGCTRWWIALESA